MKVIFTERKPKSHIIFLAGVAFILATIGLFVIRILESCKLGRLVCLVGFHTPGITQEDEKGCIYCECVRCKARVSV